MCNRKVLFGKKISIFVCVLILVLSIVLSFVWLKNENVVDALHVVNEYRTHSILQKAELIQQSSLELARKVRRTRYLNSSGKQEIIYGNHKVILYTTYVTTKDVETFFNRMPISFISIVKYPLRIEIDSVENRFPGQSHRGLFQGNNREWIIVVYADKNNEIDAFGLLAHEWMHAINASNPKAYTDLLSKIRKTGLAKKQVRKPTTFVASMYGKGTYYTVQQKINLENTLINECTAYIFQSIYVIVSETMRQYNYIDLSRALQDKKFIADLKKNWLDYVGWINKSRATLQAGVLPDVLTYYEALSRNSDSYWNEIFKILKEETLG